MRFWNAVLPSAWLKEVGFRRIVKRNWGHKPWSLFSYRALKSDRTSPPGFCGAAAQTP